MLPMQAMTDHQIGEAYQALCEAVHNWIADTFDDVDCTLFTIKAAMDRLGSNSLIDEYVMEQELQLTLDFPQTDNLMLACFVFRHLYQRFLDAQRVFPGIDSNNEYVLTKLVESLKKAKSDQGTFLFRSWSLC